jgi:hypothetical protein
MRDTVGLIMLGAGRGHLQDFTSALQRDRPDELQKHIADGQIRAGEGQLVPEDLISGDGSP